MRLHHHSAFIRSSVNGHLPCFHPLVIADNMEQGVQVSGRCFTSLGGRGCPVVSTSFGSWLLQSSQQDNFLLGEGEAVLGALGDGGGALLAGGQSGDPWPFWEGGVETTFPMLAKLGNWPGCPPPPT